MRQLILCVVCAFGFVTAVAQDLVCNLGGGNTAEISNCYLSPGKDAVIVTVLNDAYDISANVRVTVEVTYSGAANSYTKETLTKRYTSSPSLVKNNQSNTITIPIQREIPTKKDGFELSLSIVSFKAVSIAGSKCQTSPTINK